MSVQQRCECSYMTVRHSYHCRLLFSDHVDEQTKSAFLLFWHESIYIQKLNSLKPLSLSAKASFECRDWHWFLHQRASTMAAFIISCVVIDLSLSICCIQLEFTAVWYLRTLISLILIDGLSSLFGKTLQCTSHYPDSINLGMLATSGTLKQAAVLGMAASFKMLDVVVASRWASGLNIPRTAADLERFSAWRVWRESML